MRTQFTGVGTALITPFTRAGCCGRSRRERFAQIDAGVHFLVPCGTPGVPTLSIDEKRRIVELVSRGRGNVPILPRRRL